MNSVVIMVDEDDEGALVLRRRRCGHRIRAMRRRRKERANRPIAGVFYARGRSW